MSRSRASNVTHGATNPERVGTRAFNHLTKGDHVRLTEAEAIAVRMMDGQKRAPREIKPVTVRRFSWEADQ